MNTPEPEAVAASAPDRGGPPPSAAPAAPAAPAPVRMPGYGELTPAFRCLSDQNPAFQSLSLGGRWIVLMFFGSLNLPAARAAHDRILARRALFDDAHAQFFGVGVDPADRSERDLKNNLPGLRYFWDFDLGVSCLFGLARPEGFIPTAFLLDHNMRVAAVEPIDRLDRVLDELEARLRADADEPPELGAPVLTLPRVLEPDFCAALVDYYDRVGGQFSGFMREVDGVTLPVLDDGTKRRRDVIIEDESLRTRLCEAISYRIVPMLHRVFWFQASRIERYIVACYSAEDRGFFNPHRDNTTGGTAHRRFAVSINLNADFDGGDLRFPEYGQKTYRPPLGGATVFACGLLHEATPVTRGMRYATLPFLYDESGRQIRDANQHRLVTGPAIRVGG